MRSRASIAVLSAPLWLSLAAGEPSLYDSSVSVPIVSDNTTTQGCHSSCTSLLASGSAHLDVHYPHLPPDFYFFANQQHDLTPLCVVQPQSVEAVALVVKSVREHRCRFAVKSGGHSIARGTSNRQGGIVIDLKYLNQVDVSEDQETATIGPGNRWGDVYQKLEPQGLAIVGGRVSSVGVGGFTMGGGISFLSRRYGWALDNVRRFQASSDPSLVSPLRPHLTMAPQVVLPNGTVTYASQTVHSDLYFALRGGGSNFGIVTAFDFKIHKLGLVWGGVNVYLVKDLRQRREALGLRSRFDWSLHSTAVVAVGWLQKLGVSLGYGKNSRDLIDAFVKLANNEEDVAPHAYLFFSWIPFMKSYLVGSTAVYSEPVENPPILQNLTEPSGIMSSNRLARVSDFAREVDESNPRDHRNIWRTATFRVDSDLISKLWDILLEECEPLISAIPDALMSTNLQLLTKEEMKLFSRNGGNALGLDHPEDGPLFLFSITITHKFAKDDDAIRRLSDTVISRAVDVGKKMKLHHPFIYPNYAAVGQDVYAGFAPQNRQRLKDIQRTLDPSGEFSALQPEHFRV